MSEFSIIPKNVLLNVDILKSCGLKLENQIASMEKVKAGVSLGSSTGIVKAKLSASIEKLTALRNGLQTMSGQLHNIASEYVNADGRVKDNDIKTSLNEEQNKSDSDSSEDEDIDWKKIWDELVRLAGERVTSEKEWFYEYVPQNVPDRIVYNILNLLSKEDVSEEVIKENREINEKAWEQYLQEHENEMYIDDQSAMADMRYGNNTQNNNGCGTIATYNAMQYLTDGNSPDDYPDLVDKFQYNGIVLSGEFGTNPRAIDNYFRDQGYDTILLMDQQLSPANVSDISDEYDVYLLMAYNDKTDLSAGAHYVCITEEDGEYIMHNTGNTTQSYDSLEDAVFNYNNGNGEPISLNGIRK